VEVKLKLLKASACFALVGATLLLIACGAKGQSIDFTLTGNQAGFATSTGDCNAKDLALTGIEYAVQADGGLEGKGDLSLVALQRANCLTGNFSGGWVIRAESGSVLLGQLVGAFTILPSSPASWKSSGIKLNVTGGSGLFAGASGSGQCDASGTLATEPAERGKTEVACKLRLVLPS